MMVMSGNYLMPYQWHRLFYYCKSTVFCGMHFCLQYDNYSAYCVNIMLDAFRQLLCSKLCKHNRLVPNFEAFYFIENYNETTKLCMFSTLLFLRLYMIWLHVSFDPTECTNQLVLHKRILIYWCLTSIPGHILLLFLHRASVG